MQRGYAMNHQRIRFQRFGKDGKKYNIIVAPMIESISTVAGASPAGQILTIKGFGFNRIKL